MIACMIYGGKMVDEVLVISDWTLDWCNVSVCVFNMCCV